MSEISHVGDTDLWRNVPTVDLQINYIYTGGFTHYIVLDTYCLISVCLQSSFYGLYVQKRKTNITELPRKESCD